MNLTVTICLSSSTESRQPFSGLLEESTLDTPRDLQNRDGGLTLQQWPGLFPLSTLYFNA